MENVNSTKEVLQEEMDSIINELSDIAVLNTETKDWEVKLDSSQADTADESTQADASEEAESRMTTLAELENRYRHILLALEKIEKGNYGSCEICNKEIEEARLLANPAARTCIEHMNDESQLPI